MKHRTLNQYLKDAPKLPEFTCPNIDAAIDKLESLRSENSELRDCADYWKDSFVELYEMFEELSNWKKDIKKLIRES